MYRLRNRRSASAMMSSGMTGPYRLTLTRAAPNGAASARHGPGAGRACRRPAPGRVHSDSFLHYFVHDDAAGRVDERQVRERLREVAQVMRRVGVELLGVEAER